MDFLMPPAASLENSTAGIANLLKLPILFVVDVQKCPERCCVIYGFNNFHPEIKISVLSSTGSAVPTCRLLETPSERLEFRCRIHPESGELFIPGRLLVFLQLRNAKKSHGLPE